MKGKKSTRSAFLTSLMSLVLCFAMLLGTTFAWFTDTASTAVNKVQAGTLDVQLLMWDGSDYQDISNNDTPIFGSDDSLVAQNNNAGTLWEPGKTQVAYLAITNNGSLDLKYQVALDVTNVSKDLFKVMEYSIAPDMKDGTGVTAWTSGLPVVAGRQIVSVPNTGTATNPSGVILASGETHYFALSVHMMETAGNEYQGGQVDFDLTVFATQLNSEADSFGSNYDATAEYPVKINTTGGLSVTKTEASGEAPAEVKTAAEQTLGSTSADGMSVKYPQDVKLTTAVGDVSEDNEAIVTQAFEFVSNTVSDASANNSVTLQNGQSVEQYELTLPIHNTNEVLVTVEIDYGEDKQIEALYHNGSQMETSAGESTREYYEYDPLTGILTLYVFHASPIDVVLKAPVVIANGEKYYDVLKALGALDDGGTVTLLRDVTVLDETLEIQGEKTVTLDLAGNNLTVANSSSDGLVVTGGATLNLTNSVAASGKYIFECTSSSADSIYVYNMEAGKTSTLNIENPVILEIDAQTNSAIHAYGKQGNAVVNIKDGTNVKVSGRNSQTSAVIIDQNAAVNMTGGVFELNVDFDRFSYNYNDVVGVLLWGQNGAQKDLSFNLSGGTFKVGGKNAFAQGIQIGMKNGVSETCIANITGGEMILNPTEDGVGYPFTAYKATYGKFTMSGGTVSGNIDALTTTASGENAVLTVTGGTFCKDPTEYVDTNNNTVTGNNGTWTVTAKETAE